MRMEWYVYPIILIAYLVEFFVKGLIVCFLIVFFGTIHEHTKDWKPKWWQIVLFILVSGVILDLFLTEIGF